MDPVHPLLTPDAFLTQQLGCPTWHLKLRMEEPAASQRGPLHDALARLHPGPFFVDAKVPVARLDLATLVTDAGLRLIDTNLQFRKACTARKVEPRNTCRFARPADAAAVAAVAARSFVYSRFHLDPQIDREVANRLKGAWARNYFTGRRGEQMVLAEVEGQVAGFNQLLRGPDDELIIDLIAIAPEYQRRGLGRALCQYAEVNGGGRALLVGSQVVNTAAIRLYTGLGFHLVGASYVFHLHG